MRVLGNMKVWALGVIVILMLGLAGIGGYVAALRYRTGPNSSEPVMTFMVDPHALDTVQPEDPPEGDSGSGGTSPGTQPPSPTQSPPTPPTPPSSGPIGGGGGGGTPNGGDPGGVGGGGGIGSADSQFTANESCVRDLGCQASLRAPGMGRSVVTSCGTGECPNCPPNSPAAGLWVKSWCAYTEFSNTTGSCSYVVTYFGRAILGPFCFPGQPRPVPRRPPILKPKQ